MRFLDDTKPEQADRQIDLDLAQSRSEIQKSILNYCIEQQPEVLVAQGIEADYVLSILPSVAIHCGAIALKHPSLTQVNIDQLHSQYGVMLQISPLHPNYADLKQCFHLVPIEQDFEHAVQFLKNTYMLSPLDPADFSD